MTETLNDRLDRLMADIEEADQNGAPLLAAVLRDTLRVEFSEAYRSGQLVVLDEPVETIPLTDDQIKRMDDVCRAAAANTAAVMGLVEAAKLALPLIEACLSEEVTDVADWTEALDKLRAALSAFDGGKTDE